MGMNRDSDGPQSVMIFFKKNQTFEFDIHQVQ